MSEKVWAVWFGGGSGESEEGEGEREGAERGEKIRRKEENGGKKGKNESGRKSSSSISSAEIVCIWISRFVVR